MSEAENTSRWQFCGGFSSNYVMEGDGFYVSFAPNPGAGLPMFQSDDGSPETALCRNGEFYILNGDYCAEYESLIDKGFDACFEFYQGKKDAAGSSWSNSDPA